MPARVIDLRKIRRLKEMVDSPLYRGIYYMVSSGDSVTEECVLLRNIRDLVYDIVKGVDES